MFTPAHRRNSPAAAGCRCYWILLLTLIGLAAASFALASDYPAQEGYVYDGAGMLTDADEDKLETLLHEFETNTTIGIAVATVESLGGQDANNYAIELGNRWDVGDASTDNGVIVLLAERERELALWFGDGYERSWSQQTSQVTRDEFMVPQLKRGDYAGAVRNGVSQLMADLVDGGYVEKWTGLPTVSGQPVRGQSGYADTATSGPGAGAGQASPPRRIRSAAELRSRSYVMGAIVLGVLLLFLFILRSSALAKRKELQTEIATLIESLTHKLEQLPAVEQKLRGGYPESMWGPALSAINASALERLIYTDATKLGSKELTRLRDELRAANGSCERALELLRRADSAQANVPGLLRELPSRLDALQAQLGGPDVPAETAAQLAPLRVRLSELAQRVAQAQPNTTYTDWAALGDAADKLAADADALGQKAEQDAAQVSRARAELPGLLGGAEEQLAQLRALNRGRYVEVEAALDEAAGMLGDWRGYGDFRRLPASEVYLILGAVNNALARAQQARNVYEQRSRPASSGGSSFGRGGGGSSSWGGGSSGGSSFGGSRGGGGGSSKW